MDRTGLALGYGKFTNAREMASFMRDAEERGYEMGFFSETIELMRDSVTSLAAIGLATEKLVMGSFIPVKIDMSDAAQPQPIADAYAVFGLPTVLVTDAEGRTLKGIEGYVDADDLLAQLAP